MMKLLWITRSLLSEDYKRAYTSDGILLCREYLRYCLIKNSCYILYYRLQGWDWRLRPATVVHPGPRQRARPAHCRAGAAGQSGRHHPVLLRLEALQVLRRDWQVLMSTSVCVPWKYCFYCVLYFITLKLYVNEHVYVYWSSYIHYTYIFVVTYKLWKIYQMLEVPLSKNGDPFQNTADYLFLNFLEGD